ncbi:DUF3841 domain-containing protein [Myxococcaceae bacterium GXIMD 01537]
MVRCAAELERAHWPLRANEDFVDSYMRPAYRWMARELANRVGPPPRGVRLPLWAWVERPDLRSGAHLRRGTRGVLLELELPRRAVLLSDFERFHAVLNRHYLARSASDEARFERHVERSGDGLRRPSARSIRPEVEASWPRIFSFAARVRDPAYYGPAEEAPVQAVFWELHEEQVVGVRAFTAR